MVFRLPVPTRKGGRMEQDITHKGINGLRFTVVPIKGHGLGIRR